MSKKFSIITYGCKVNQYDSQLLRHSFLLSGYEETRDLTEADIIVVNGCVVTHRAERDARHALHRALRKAREKADIYLLGCAAKYGLDVEGVNKAGSLDELLRLLNLEKADGIRDFGGRKRPYLKVQEGCSFRCAYCVVPLVRGPSRSRELQEIKKEAEELLKAGFREIVLTGTQIGDWGKEFGLRLENLIEELLSLPYRFRLRISSISPLHVTEKLLEFIRPELPNLVPHFHMSLQSGSPRILKLMRRPYTRELFLEKAEMLLERTPLMSLGTDVIAGYPAETEEDFLETVELLERIPFSYLHVFEFSPRRGTEAFSLKEIHPAERKRRVKILLEIRSCKMREYREKFVGKKLQVIAEKVKNGVLEGTSENYLRIRFEGPESLLGEIIDVTVTGIDENMLTGTVQSQSKAAILRL